MERNYTKIWWQHCLAIIGFSVIPLLIVNIALFLLFNRIYTDKVSENLQNRVEGRRDTVDLFLNERVAQIYTVAQTNKVQDLADEAYLNRIFSIHSRAEDDRLDAVQVHHVRVAPSAARRQLRPDAKPTTRIRTH